MRFFQKHSQSAPACDAAQEEGGQGGGLHGRPQGEHADSAGSQELDELETPRRERPPQTFVLSSINRRCKTCGRLSGTDRATMIDRSSARLWDRAGQGKGALKNASTPTHLEYSALAAREKLTLGEAHHRACVCYRRTSDMQAMMLHRALPVVTGTDRIQYPGGDVYVGELKNLLLHGKGMYTFNNGSKFCGHFWKGKMHGIGESIYRLGGIYRGELNMGQRQGHGSYIYSTTWVKEEKEEYVGAWVGDAPMGWGLLLFKNGDAYLGCFRDGLFDGPGPSSQKVLWIVTFIR